MNHSSKLRQRKRINSQRNTIKLVAFGLCAVALLGLLALFGGVLGNSLASLGIVALGATLSQGILGPVRGKVGPVVGGAWKGINYIRAHVIPANPRTDAQTDNRSKFAAISSIGSAVLGSILQPYRDPLNAQQSGHNAFVSDNMGIMELGNDMFATLFTRGDLEVPENLVINEGGANVAVDFDTTPAGNGQTTDSIVGVATSVVGSQVRQIVTGATRADGKVTFDEIPAVESEDWAYHLFAHRTESNGDLRVSNDARLYYDNTQWVELDGLGPVDHFIPTPS